MLHSLTTKKNIRTFSVCPENFTGEKGKGGMAVEGSASLASRELGQGWKVNPFVMVEAGTSFVMADVKGQGAIKHIWITDAAPAGRLLILRIWFDGAKKSLGRSAAFGFLCQCRSHRISSDLEPCDLCQSCARSQLLL